jgi:hypothetical protein
MAGPPHVAFTWRHWAEFSGAYKGNQGDGSTVELYGFCIATVNSSLKVEELQIFYKPEDFLRVLEVSINGFLSTRSDSPSTGASLLSAGLEFCY